MAKLSANGKVTGFASPAQGYEETAIDLNSLLIRNPAATYFFRLDSGDMESMGLLKGTLLVVDRSRKPVMNNFVLIRYEGHFLCRLMADRNGCTVFTDNFIDIKPTIDDTEIIGVVTASIKEH